ncbi:helix-turn-helix transcriptional regulator [Limibacterium fermenti]|uniref:helix-turn-helix transcriptional regulator n=1 Tax=Limibacterium fermenti TaxID=3229863 RepID=UPI003A683409
MAKGLERLVELSKGQVSTWRQEAEWRETNKEWLKHSAQIAVQVLFAIKDKGITQKELALRMGVSPQYVNKIVKGSENLSLETISKIEQALSISLISINTYYPLPELKPLLVPMKFSQINSTILKDRDYIPYTESNDNKPKAA